MQYKENINEIYSILDSYFRNKKHQLEDSQVDQIHKCYNKLTNEAKISLLENCEFTFYVNNINLSRQRLYAEHILDIEDSTFVYLIYKIIDFMHFKNKDIASSHVPLSHQNPTNNTSDKLIEESGLPK
jgi:hypothetical protein